MLKPLLISLLLCLTGTGVSQTTSRGISTSSDFPGLMAAYEKSEGILQSDRKLANPPKISAVAKYLTDDITVTFKPEFSNTFPNLLGNPVVSTDQFTWKGQVFGAQY